MRLSHRATMADMLREAYRRRHGGPLLEHIRPGPLSLRQVRVLELALRDGETNDAIAARLGLSRATVGLAKSQALDALAAALGGMERPAG